MMKKLSEKVAVTLALPKKRFLYQFFVYRSGKSLPPSRFFYFYFDDRTVLLQ